MRKTALVLSGGGARGAAEIAAVKYAMKVKGYRWDVISGVSVGAINGAMIAQGQLDTAFQRWKTLTREMVYTGHRASWKTATRLLFGAKSVYDTTPLARLIDQEIDPSKMAGVDLRIGAVSLQKRRYFQFRPPDPNFKKALLASAAIPTIFPPVDVSPDHPCMADGALKNYSPIGDVMDAEPDEIVIVSCRPRELPELAAPPQNALRVGLAAIEIMTHMLFLNDLKKFESMNRAVASMSWMLTQVTGSGVVIPEHIPLRSRQGRPYRCIEYRVIEPDRELGDALDFSRQNIDLCMEAGWEMARKALG